MNPVVKNTLAVIAGLVVGTVVNMGLVIIGPYVIPVPEGADTSTMEGLKASMALFQPKHFLFPFLAHALGTLAGAFAAAFIASSHQIKFALIIGGFFLLGGTTMAVTVGGPAWFLTTDLVLAYLPMGYLGAILAMKMKSKKE